jgi:hypothetical protein
LSSCAHTEFDRTLIFHRENNFEDGSQNLYRFLEHDPAVPKYYNFRGSTSDGEPKPAALVGQRMTKIMLAILEAYASDDYRHLDYSRIAASEEFIRCVRHNTSAS